MNRQTQARLFAEGLKRTNGWHSEDNGPIVVGYIFVSLFSGLMGMIVMFFLMQAFS